MEEGEEERDYYTYRYAVITRMIPALRWAAMRAILMFQWDVMDKVTRQRPQTTIFLKRKDSRSGIEPRSLPLLTKTHMFCRMVYIVILVPCQGCYGIFEVRNCIVYAYEHN